MVKYDEDHRARSMDQCVGKTMLAYVDYPFSGQRCFSYPQYIYEDDTFTDIGSGAFPDIGCLPMTIAGNYTTDELSSKYGNLVVMKLNTADIQENINYPGRESSRFNGIINPAHPHSVIEFTKLSNHGLSTSLIQVIDIQENVSLAKPLDLPVHLGPDQVQPQTKYVLISKVVNGQKLYCGPFEFAVQAEGLVSLKASPVYGNLIYCVSERNLDFSIALHDENETTAAVFVSADEFTNNLSKASDEFDWITDDELIEAIGRISITNDVELSKSQMRKLKVAINRYSEDSAKIAFTEERRSRMVKLLDGYADWRNLPEQVKSQTIESIPMNQLAEYVLSDVNFQGFFEKVIENDQVRERISRMKHELSAEIEGLKKEIDEAEQKRDSIIKEINELQNSKREILDEYHQEAQDELEILNAELADKKLKVEKISEELERLKRDSIVAEQQVESIVDSMSGLKANEKILENIVVRKIIESVAPASYTISAEESIGGIDKRLDDTNDVESEVPIFHTRADESELNDEDVIDVLERGISEQAGLGYSRNEVINLLICLVQGYVLTLAGMPGTGKTTLAHIIGDILGLSSEGVDRFREVSVEKGWTSYKDFIGYYNPFTNTVEKANPNVFDAFARLDIEARSGRSNRAPFVFLLDEANLSSIEHYWAPFLRACDSFHYGPSRLSLGGPNELLVPESTRFLATVNFDYTTEELSPRFLDRSWVITLDSDPIDFMEDDLPNTPSRISTDSPFSYSKLLEVFSVRSDDIVQKTLLVKAKEVFDIFAKYGVPISRRSQTMIKNYMGTASRLMDMSTADSNYAPVDFSISQKILPSLNGPAERLEDLLEELAGVSGLGRTVERVKHMIAMGKDNGYYQYFA